MKKRIVEAAAIFAAVVLVFIVSNLFLSGIDGVTAEIDGAVYSTGETELELALLTTEGVQELSRFDRLEKLTIRPYTAALAASYELDDPQRAAALKIEAEKTYKDCTKLEDISFLKDIKSLRVLDISYCETDDISCLTALENLEAVNISYTAVTSLEPLKELAKLETLYIYGIPVDDMSPLLDMQALKKVCLDEDAGDEIIGELKSKGITVEIKEKSMAEKVIEYTYNQATK